MFDEKDGQKGALTLDMFRLRGEYPGWGYEYTDDEGLRYHVNDERLDDFTRLWSDAKRPMRMTKSPQPSMLGILKDAFTNSKYWTDPEGKQGVLTYQLENIARGVAGTATAAAVGAAKGLADAGLSVAGLAADAVGGGEFAEGARRLQRGIDSAAEGALGFVADDILGKRFTHGTVEGKAAVNAALGAARELGGLWSLGQIGKAAGAKGVATAMGAEGYSAQMNATEAQGRKADSRTVLAASINAGVNAGIAPLYGRLAGIIGPDRASRLLYRSVPQLFEAAAVDILEGGALGALNQAGAEVANAVRGDDRSLEDRARSVFSAAAVGSALVMATRIPGALDTLTYPVRRTLAGEDRMAASAWVNENRQRYAPAVEAQAESALRIAGQGLPLVQSRGVAPDVRAVTVNGEVIFTDGTVYRPARGDMRMADGTVRKGRAARIIVADGTILDVKGEVVGRTAGPLRQSETIDTAAEYYHRANDLASWNYFRIIDPATGEVGEWHAGDGSVPDSVMKWKAWRDLPPEERVKTHAPELDADGYAFMSLLHRANGADLDAARTAQMALDDVSAGRRSAQEAAEAVDEAVSYATGGSGAGSIWGAFKFGRESKGGDAAGAKSTAETQETTSETVVRTDVPALVGVGTRGIPGRAAGDGAVALVREMQSGGVRTETVPVADIFGAAPSAGGVARTEVPHETPIVVFEDGDGMRTVMSGARRLGEAKSGNVKSVEAVVLRAEDGWSAASARLVGQLDNLCNGTISGCEAVRALSDLGLDGETVDVVLGDMAGRYAREMEVVQNASAGTLARLNDDSLPLVEGLVRSTSVERLGEGWEKAQEALMDSVPDHLASADGAEGMRRMIAENAGVIYAAGMKGGGWTCTPVRAWELASWHAAQNPGDSPAFADIVLFPDILESMMARDRAGNTPVETAEGSITTVGRLELEQAGMRSGQGLERSAATVQDHSLDLVAKDGADGVWTVPGVHGLEIVAEGGCLYVTGLDYASALDGRNAARLGRLVSKLNDMALEGGVKLCFETPELASLAGRLLEYDRVNAVTAEDAARGQAVIDVLKNSGLAKDVILDGEAFRAKLLEHPNGTELVADGLTYGFTDGESVWLNAAFFGTRQGLNTSIHEFGHLGVIALKSANRSLYDRGIRLVQDTQYFKEVSGHPDYKEDSPEKRAEEALVRLIADRGERLKADVPEKVYEEIKAFVRDFWAQFGKDVLGVADLTPEMAASMSVEDIADAVRAEMMSGRPFGSASAAAKAKGDAGGDVSLARALVDGRETAFAVGYPLSKRDARDPEKVLKLLGGLVGKSAAQIGEKELTRINWKSVEHLVLSDHAMRLRTTGGNSSKNLWRGSVAGMSVIDDIVATSFLGDRSAANHINQHWKADATFYKAATRFAVRTEDGYEIYPCNLIVVELKGKGRLVYDLTEIGMPTHTARVELESPAPLSKGTVATAVSAMNGIISNSDRSGQEGKTNLNSRLHFSRGGIYTGSAADYANRSRQGGVDDGPSLKKIGSGEGQQVYGWGLYGSTERGVAEKYAGEKKARGILSEKRGKRSDQMEEAEGLAAYYFERNNGDVEAAKRELREYIELDKDNDKLVKSLTAAVKELEEHGGEYEMLKENVYEQTFFTDRAPGDESHLLKWYEPVSAEQLGLLRELGLNIQEKSRIVEGQEVRRIQIKRGDELLLQVRDASEITGEDVYRLVSKATGSPKSASEWLAAHGIDGVKYPVDSYGGKGVKDGDKAGWNYVSFRDDNIRVDHKWTDGRQMYARGGSPLSAITVGTRRVTQQLAYSEQSGAAHLAGIELLNSEMPALDPNITHPIAMSASEITRLYRLVTGQLFNPLTVRARKRQTWLGKRMGDKIYVLKDIFGMLDKSDLAAAKEWCRRQGLYMHEDPIWRATARPSDVTAMRTASETALEGELVRIGEERVSGLAGGGNRAATNVLAHELGHIICDLPVDSSGVMGGMRRLGDALIGKFERQLDNPGYAALRDEALRFAAWWRGTSGKTLQQVSAADVEPYFEKPRELWAEMFGAFLASPDQLRQEAPNIYREMVDAITSNDRLVDALTELRRTSMSGGHVERLMADIDRRHSLDIERRIQALEDAARRPIGTLAEQAYDIVSYNWSTMNGPLYHFISRAQKRAVVAAKAALKRGDITEAQYRLVAGEEDRILKDLRIGQLAMERGRQGEIREYVWDQAVLLHGAREAGMDLNQFRRYGYLKWVIGSQGRSAARNMSPREAQVALDEMRYDLGEAKYAEIENTFRRWQAIRQRHILSDARLVQALGGAYVDYLKSNADYVRTERTWSAEEVEAAAQMREAYRQAHPNGDDVIDVMLDLVETHRRSFGQGGLTSMFKPLVGSSRDVKDWIEATLRNDERICGWLARNDYVIRMRDGLTRLNVDGVKDLPYKEGIRYPEGDRYGLIGYVEDGRRRVLVVPAMIARGYRHDASSLEGWDAVSRYMHGALIDWNLLYTPNNYNRNLRSNEANLEGMRQNNLALALNYALPGGSDKIDIFLTEFARRMPDYYFRNPLSRLIFGRNTNIYFAAQAQRMLEMYLHPEKVAKLQSEADEAARHGDQSKAIQLAEDIEALRYAMKGNALIARFGAVKGGGALDDYLRGRSLGGLGTEPGKGAVMRILAAAAKPFTFNADFNRDLELWAKMVATLQQRSVNPGATPGEVGLKVAQGASIPVVEGSAAPGQAKFVNNAWNLYWSTARAGYMRWWGNVKERPAETLGKMAVARLLPRFIWRFGIYGGLLAALIKWMSGGDERKAESGPLGGLLGWLKEMRRRDMNVSEYMQRYYNSFHVARWGDVTLSFASRLTDEERILSPVVDYMAAQLAPNPTDPTVSVGSVAKDMTLGTIIPDFRARTPVMAALQDSIGALMGFNPTDVMRSTNVYGKDLFAARGESAADFGVFLAKMAGQVGNDLGLRAVVTPGRAGVDEAEGVPRGIHALMREIPIVSPVANGFLRLSMNGDRRREQVLRDLDEPRRAVRRQRVRELAEMLQEDFAGTDADKLLDGWQRKYEWNDTERMDVYLRAFNRALRAEADPEDDDLDISLERRYLRSSEATRRKFDAYLGR
jgi:hypothetical protein